MASGFTSKYNDAGYTLPTDVVPTWYDASNTVVAGPLPSQDIYITTQQVGVYMFNGTIQNTTTITPIFSSLKQVTNIGIASNSDDAWLVYPSWGFALYDKDDYTDLMTKYYTNTSTIPILFTFYNGGYAGVGTQIQNSGSQGINANSTNSVKIYFRGKEVTVWGLY